MELLKSNLKKQQNMKLKDSGALTVKAKLLKSKCLSDKESRSRLGRSFSGERWLLCAPRNSRRPDLLCAIWSFLALVQ